MNLEPEELILFTDGACSGNPGPGGWGVVALLPESQIREWGGSHTMTTNNRMELTASLEGLHRTMTFAESPVRVYTDSTYVISGITRWIWGWIRQGWKTAQGTSVSNQDLWQALFEATRHRSIKWCYVKGHAGIPGNERADQIAVAFARRRLLTLYSGLRENHPIDFSCPIQESGNLPPASKNKKSSSLSAYSYLSVIGGVPMRHSTWAECEKRVKGQAGARYQKAMTAVEEKEILGSWGFRSDEVV